MKFQPLIPWWVLLPLGLFSLAVLGWHARNLYRQKDLPVTYAWVRRIGLVFLLILVATGPSLPLGASVSSATNLDVYFAVDTTASMGATDCAGTDIRFDCIKKDLLALGNRLQGAHITIITFDSKATTILPETTDQQTFVVAVNNMNREQYNTSTGSTIDKPLDLLAQQLKTSKQLHPDWSRLLFYMTDGEQTTKSPVKSFAQLANYLQGGAVLGYGTTQGAHMLKYTGLTNQAGSSPYVQMVNPATKGFVPAISKMDPTNLKKIASQLRLPYVDRDQGGSLTNVYQQSHVTTLANTTMRITHYVNLYWFFMLPAVVLIFWDWQQLFQLLITLHPLPKKKLDK